MVWILEWTQPGQSMIRVEAYALEDYALVSACAGIMTTVSDEWDRADVDCQAFALKVNDACACLDFRKAIELFNEWEGDGDFEFMQHYRVYQRKEVTTLPAIKLLRSLPTTQPRPVSTPPAAWVAQHPGATCRGPCKQVSTDAYADRIDGTFCCFQCKLMSNAFGKPIP